MSVPGHTGMMQAAYGAGLPVPFNYFITWRQRRAVQQRFAATTGEQARQQTAFAALKAKQQFVPYLHRQTSGPIVQL